MKKKLPVESKAAAAEVEVEVEVWSDHPLDLSSLSQKDLKMLLKKLKVPVPGGKRGKKKNKNKVDELRKVARAGVSAADPELICNAGLMFNQSEDVVQNFGVAAMLAEAAANAGHAMSMNNLGQFVPGQLGSRARLCQEF